MKRSAGRCWGGMVLAALLAGQALASGPQGVGRAQLSRGGEGWEASAGIDSQGHSVALWVQRIGTQTVQDRVWTRSHAPAQAWGPHTTLSPALRTTQNAPAVRVSATGKAIAVWADADGIWTAERPARGAWGMARLLVPGAASPMLAMNAQGDAALAWSTGSQRGAATELKVMRRDSGGDWRVAQVLARGSTSSANVEMNDLAIADGTGEVVAAWERFQTVCQQYCTRHDHILHASRAGRGSDAWVDSGALSGPLPFSHRSRAVVDPAGRAGIVFALDFQGVMATSQSGQGMAWTQPALVYAATFAYVAGLACDAGGHVTVGFLDDDGGGSLQVVAMDGNLATGLWDPPVPVSRSDLSVGQTMLAGSAGGAAILTWTSGDELFEHNVVRVSTRAATGSAWTRPRTISPAGAEVPVPEAAAVNSSGQGIVVFSAFDVTFTVHTEYAVTN